MRHFSVARIQNTFDPGPHEFGSLTIVACVYVDSRVAGKKRWNHEMGLRQCNDRLWGCNDLQDPAEKAAIIMRTFQARRDLAPASNRPPKSIKVVVSSSVRVVCSRSSDTEINVCAAFLE